MILRGDIATVGTYLTNRLVMRTVTIFQFVDSSTGSLAQQLITHTDTTDGLTALSHLTLQDIYSLYTTVWVTRTISQEEPIKLHVRIVVIPGDPDYLYPAINQTADDILLNTTIDKHHLTACPFVIADDILARATQLTEP